MQISKLAIVALIAAALTAPSPAEAQKTPGGVSRSRSGGASQTADEEAVFAPFPSRLRVAVKEGSVVLSWTDSGDIGGNYAVYRSTEPLNAATFPSATKLGEVKAGTQTYIDTPPDDKPYYYLVLALSEDGNPYQVFIPARNTTYLSVAVAPPPPAPPTPTPPPAAESEQIALAVDDINLQTQDDAVVLRYRPQSSGMSLVLYRGMSRLESVTSLLDAVLVATFQDKDGVFVDYPVPGIDYWYAILGEEELKTGRIRLSSGHNTTAGPTKIASRPQITGIAALPPSSRTPPLPYFRLERSPGTEASELPRSVNPPPARSLSPETEKALSSLLASAPVRKSSLPPLRLLPEERSAPAGGEDYALSLITSGKLVPGDWTGAADQLRKYLSLNRSPAAASRAHFYLGQALSYIGSYRDAFFEFLSARPLHSAETKPWIDYLLTLLPKG